MQLDPVALVWACGWPPVFAVTLSYLFRSRPDPSRFAESWACAAIGGILAFAVAREPVPLAVSAGQLLVAAVLWWLSRRRRKRSPKLAGAKSRALLAAVVAKMRQSLKPRPVFRPAPGGARA
jgi:hypothetical protein